MYFVFFYIHRCLDNSHQQQQQQNWTKLISNVDQNKNVLFNFNQSLSKST